MATKEEIKASEKAADDKAESQVKLLNMNMQDLVMYAEKQGIDTYSKTRVDILTDLGVTKEKGGKVYVRPQPSAEKLKVLQDRGYLVPQNTVFPADEFNKWMKIIAVQPNAFNGVDLTDKEAEIRHTLKIRNTCVCGASVTFPWDERRPNKKRRHTSMMCPGMEGTIRRKGVLYPVRRCMAINSFRKWLLHLIPEEEAV